MKCKKIMIVEDEPAILMLLKKIFLHGQNTVVACATRDEAEQALSLDFFDLVITDVRLSWSDQRGGIELLQYIKEKYPSTEVIVMTGYGLRDTGDEVYRKGALHFYEKPFDFRHLSELVRTRLDIGVRLSPKIQSAANY